MLDLFQWQNANSVLIKSGHKVLLAVSGGMDSVAMTNLFHLSSIPFAIAHCNFGLRGGDSDDDEIFVMNLARSMKVEFFVKRFETTQFAATHGISIQMAARQLRYEWFEKVRFQSGCDLIATAHHCDDNNETILINILRGTGLRGLRGIPATSGNIIRPMATVGRQEIEAHIKSQELKYREDASNADDKYLRNSIRHNILPLLTEINPSLHKTLGDLSHMATQAVELLEYFVNKEVIPSIKNVKGNAYIPIAKILQYPSSTILLFELLRAYNFQSEVVKDLADNLHSQPGKLYYSPTHICLKDREYLVVSPIDKSDTDAVYIIKDGDTSIDLPDSKISFSQSTIRGITDFINDNNIAYLDADKLTFPLQLRHMRDGDHFIPLGMTGKKKISDFLADIKMPRTQKRKVWLLTSNETIVWIVGYRIHDHFKIQKGSKMLLKAKFAPHQT